LATDAADCGANYYGQYKVRVQNNDPVGTDESAKPFDIVVSGTNGATYADSLGCLAPCAPPPLPSSPATSAVFKIDGLIAGGSTEFTVFFRSPNQTSQATPTTPAMPTSFDATAKPIIGPRFNPQVDPLDTLTSKSTIVLTDGAPEYISDVPPVGGSAKAKNTLDPSGAGPFSSRVDVPSYTVGNAVGSFPTTLDIDLKVKPGDTSCSSWSPKCLETELDVRSNGNAVTFAEGVALNGSQLVITMVRQASTLNKKPSSVFNATVWYTDTLTGNRTAIKDCGSVKLTTAERCVAQRIDMTGTAPDGTRTGYVKFVIWARHNGKIGY